MLSVSGMVAIISDMFLLVLDNTIIGNSPIKGNILFITSASFNINAIGCNDFTFSSKELKELILTIENPFFCKNKRCFLLATFSSPGTKYMRFLLTASPSTWSKVPPPNGRGL